MGAGDDLRQELEEIDELLVGLPEGSATRRNLEVRRAEIVGQLDADDGNQPATGPAVSTPYSDAGDGRKRPLVPLLIVGAVLALAVGGGAIWWVASHASVPDVTAEARGYASGVLRSAGFEVEVVTEPDPDVAEGQVLDQDPAAGERLRTGESVTLTVAELPTYDARGEFSLVASTDGRDDDCYGSGGYSDIRSGVTVTVRDSGGTTLATGRLDTGSRSSPGRCVFPFEVADIPQSDFYSFEVGRRGELTYSHSEMESTGWAVYFELGN